MRLIKMLGLAALAAMTAMAFVGASTASAEFSTTICDIAAETLECPEENQVELFTMLAQNTVLVAGSVTVLCLHSKAAAEVEKDAEGNPITLGNPLLIKLHELDFLECGRTEAHNDCEVNVEQLPLLKVLKTAKDLGIALVNPELPAIISVHCGFFINCKYEETVKPFTVQSALHPDESAGNGMFNANELEVAEGKGFLCPEKATWTALYEPLKHLWIRS